MLCIIAARVIYNIIYVVFLFFFSVGFPFSPFAVSGFSGLIFSRLAVLSLANIATFGQIWPYLCKKFIF